MGRFDMARVRALRDKELASRALYLSGELPGDPLGAEADQIAYRQAWLRRMEPDPAAMDAGAGRRLVHYETIMEMNALPASLPLHVYQHGRYFPLDPHVHDYYEMVCMVDGQCQHTIGNDRSMLSRGDIALIPPGTIHDIEAFGDDCIVFNLGFSASTAAQFLNEMEGLSHPMFSLFQQAQERTSVGCYLIFRTGDYLLGDNLLADIAAELAMKEPFVDPILSALLHSFLLFLMRHFSTDILWFAGEDISPEERVTLYIRNHFRTITLGELERQFNYSGRQLQRMIRKAAGCTFTEYMNAQRFDFVLRQLTETSFSVSQILEWAGISNVAHFYRSFQQRYGTTPAEYRKRRR